MKKKWWMLICILGCLFLVACQNEEKKWYEKSCVVTHALGETSDGDTLTNSLEALTYNYERGARVFETDLQETTDHVMVLRHDWTSDLGQGEVFGWSEDEQFAVDEKTFLSAKINGRYTPMTWLSLLQFMDSHEDMYVILDPKFSTDVPHQFSLIVDTAKDNGLADVLKRVVVQLYYEDMLSEVESVYHFENYLYTLYYVGYPGAEEISAFCEKNDIPVMVIEYRAFTSEMWQDLHAQKTCPKVYVHTVNKPQDAVDVSVLPVDGIYSDRIVNEDMEVLLKASGTR